MQSQHAADENYGGRDVAREGRARLKWAVLPPIQLIITDIKLITFG